MRYLMPIKCLLLVKAMMLAATADKVFREDRTMRKVNVEDKTQIKQLLYTGNVFGLRGDQFRAFGGF